MIPKYHRIKKLETKKSYRMKVINLYEQNLKSIIMASQKPKHSQKGQKKLKMTPNYHQIKMKENKKITKL